MVYNNTSTGGTLYNSLLYSTLLYGSPLPTWYEEYMQTSHAYGVHSTNYNKSKYKKHIYSLNFQVK